MTFETAITRTAETLTGPLRAPAQMLAEQEYAGHTSVHDDETAAELGLAGAPIEGPTHFSQIDPLAVEHWGQQWFETGCVSAHFLNMVVEGDEVRAALEPTTASLARIRAEKADGTPVLTGTASVGRDATTELDERRRRGLEDPGTLHIVDQLELGMTVTDGAGDHGVRRPQRAALPVHAGPEAGQDHRVVVVVSGRWRQPVGAPDRSNRDDQRDRPPVERTLPGARSGDRVVHRSRSSFRRRTGVRRPALRGRTHLVGIGQSKRVESYWTETTLTDAETGIHAATVLLHQGVFKASYADYPHADAAAAQRSSG